MTFFFKMITKLRKDFALLLIYDEWTLLPSSGYQEIVCLFVCLFVFTLVFNIKENEECYLTIQS